MEIERPDILLLRQDGAISADLEHAMGQVNDWLHTFDHHRNACLECIGLSVGEVVQVAGVVVAGRDSSVTDQQKLARLKWRDFGRVTFLTYDDLGRGLVALLRRFALL